MKYIILCSVFLTFLSTGCGTIASQIESREVFLQKNEYGSYDRNDDCCLVTTHFYSGVITDIKMLSFPSSCPCSGEGGLAFLMIWPIFIPLSIIDLPLSAVADTLVLPYSIPRQIKYGNISEECDYCDERFR